MPLLRRLRVAFRISAVGFLSSSVARLRVLEQPDPVGRVGSDGATDTSGAGSGLTNIAASPIVSARSGRRGAHRGDLLTLYADCCH